MGKLIKMRIVAVMLTFVMLFMNCYVEEVFAEKNNGNSGYNDNKKPEKQEHTKKSKSNSRTDVIIKYRNASQRDNTIKNSKNTAKASKFEQKRYFNKSKTGVYEVGASDDLEAIIEVLNEDPNVEYAQPNYPLTVESIPTDELFRNQWAIYNDGQDVEGIVGRAEVDINVLRAWDISKGSSDVVVGVLDTGIDTSHKDLINNIYNNKKEIPGNGKDDDGNGYIDDIKGWDFSNDDASVYDKAVSDTHGTYIAGIIAAGANNGGIVGVAPNVKVLPLKFIDGTTGYTSDAIEAIEYAMNMGVKIINCSFGGTDNNRALMEAMQNSGILFVCAAGNGGNNTGDKNIYPAGFNLDNVLSVTAIDSNGILPPFANYGANVDIAAPGTHILGTRPEGRYEYYSGTSVSAAIVSGIAALTKSAFPSLSISGIKNRIISYAAPCTSLTGKVVTGGRADAYGALSGTIQSIDSYNGPGNNTDVLPTEGEGKADTWYIMDELASNAERFHYGEGGVNPSSGNYSVTCTDMSAPAPGFIVNISRTYNSRNQRQTLLGRGWTFGFEGMITNKGNKIEISLPNGSCHVFVLENKKYVGEGTRAELVKDASGIYILTTTDQYKYGFDSASNKITYMADRNGNRINLTYANGKLMKVADTVGREYVLAYNDNSLLSSVTDPSGRKITYTYNTNNLLSKVTDPEGSILTYEYDSSQYLINQIDQNSNLFQSLTYSHDFGDTANKVIESKDANGETWSYSYDPANNKTTITNNKGRTWTYWFDIFMYTVQVQYPDGKISTTTYDYSKVDYTNIYTYYGDILETQDRNGNRTDYVVDSRTGNTTKVTKPDGGFRTFVYDQWNNVIEEVNEAGSRTFYIYDLNGANLLKKVKPLNGTDSYTNGNTTNFAVTSYTYYTKSEAGNLFGCNVAGLLKTETDPEGNVKTYTYDRCGNIASITDAAGNTTTYTYDSIGQKLTETTAKGNVTRWKYNNNGQVIKVINPDGGVERTIYDKAGHTLLEVAPNNYNSALDNNSTNVYTGTIGTKYEYYSSGNLKSVTDTENNKTEYEYDVFGNRTKEKKPNGAIYRYEYDSMDRLTKTYFKDNTTAAEVILSEVSYGILPDGSTQTTTTTYADDIHKATVISITDYAGREVMTQYADLNKTKTAYNTNGTISEIIAANGATSYYAYDPLGNLTNKWSPVTVTDGITMYSWTGYAYDKAGNLLSEMTGRPLVTLNSTTEDAYTVYYSYDSGLMKMQTDSEGRKKLYDYDGEGRINKTTRYISPSEYQITVTDYNYLGKPTSVTTKVRAGDIAGNNYEDNNILDIITTYSYDLNGNLTGITDAAGNQTTYTYDKLNRMLSTTKQLKNSDNTITNVKTSQTYAWDDRVTTATDEKGNVSHYSYDAKGNQTQIVDALGNVTLKYYNRAGNNTAIVSPKNYIAGATLADMERTEYIYDLMGRVIKQMQNYQKMSLDGSYGWTKQWVNITTNSYCYDALGNVISVTDALGNTINSDYNLAGFAESITDAETLATGLPYTVRYDYNGLWQKIKETYKGAAYCYTYDGAGNLLSTQLNGIIESQKSYDYLGRGVSSTDGNGNTTVMSWNSFGKMSRITTPGDATIPSNNTINQYDVLGNLVYSRNSIGKVSTFSYDSLRRNLSRSISDGTSGQMITSSNTYDLNGNVLTEKDANGNITSYNYDALNRVISMTNALSQTTTYTYDANSNQTSVKDYLGNTTIKVYDGINRLAEIRDALGNIVEQILYNKADAQTSSFDALHNETRFIYDRSLRKIGTIDAEGNTSSLTYDTRGNVKNKTDGNGNTTSYEYDGANRLICVMDALGNNTLYSYDAAGNLVYQTDGNGNTTTYRYNAANLRIAKTDPVANGDPAQTESYTYYPNGLMATKTDRKRITTVYTYDIFGRLLSENAGGEVQSYVYDKNGNLLEMTDSTGTTTRTYDKLNRNTRKTVPGIGLSIYDYDIKPGVQDGTYSERTTDPKGNITIKTYDQVGRISAVTTGTGTTTYVYFANGTRAKVIYPDGTTETYSYDRNNRVIGLINAKADKTVISSYQYTYDGAGNQLTKAEAKGTTTYTYDSLNRLSSVAESEGKMTSYTYDGAGNRKTEQVRSGLVGSDTVYNYDSRNRLISTVSTGGAYIRYIYDNNGNLVSKTSGIIEPINTGADLTLADLPNFGLIIKRAAKTGTGTGDITLCSYDNYNRLTVTKSGNTTATYRYNAQGYRVEKTVNNKTTRYLYEVDKVVLETDAANKQTAFMAYGTNLLYRTVAADGTTAAQSYYYLYNAHGDVTSLIEAKGNIAATYDYDAFGNILNVT